MCVTSRSSEFSQQSITPEKTLPSSNVTRTNNKVFAHIIEESNAIREDVHVTVTYSAKVEEGTILEAFRNLQRFKMSQIKSNSSLRENNLKKSLQNGS